jgi:hypothetical protein
MNADLARALSVVMSDVARSGLPADVVEDKDWVGDPGFQVGAQLWSPYGGAQGVSVLVGEPIDDQLVSVADQVQEFVHEGLLWTAVRPVVWPECPRHPNSHPLAPVNDERSGPVWTCPRDRTVVARIGELAAPDETLSCRT